jgi:hypothetical protein
MQLFTTSSTGPRSIAQESLGGSRGPVVVAACGLSAAYVQSRSRLQRLRNQRPIVVQHPLSCGRAIPQVDLHPVSVSTECGVTADSMQSDSEKKPMKAFRNATHKRSFAYMWCSYLALLTAVYAFQQGVLLPGGISPAAHL